MQSNLRVQAELRGENDPPVLNIELPISISAIRLVHPIKDPETGITRDVIINQLVHKGLIHDRLSGKSRWSRIVPGLNVSIPWPKKEEAEYKDYKCDTLRIDVEEKTFRPTLLRPPFPPSVIDELRNKYSRFRTRHEPEYIARLEAEEKAKEDRKKLMDTMRTPLQELHRAERANKKKKGKPRLTIEMLEKIGEVMARNMERTRNAGLALPEASTTSTAADSSSSSSPEQPAAEAPIPPPPTESNVEPSSSSSSPPSSSSDPPSSSSTP